MSTNPIPRPCGAVGQPACPPIECIKHVNGIPIATVEGRDFALVERVEPAAAAAAEEPAQGTEESA